jgi:hypothetical protein
MRIGEERSHLRRPPTPPYVRFRIRRFMTSTGNEAVAPAATRVHNEQSRIAFCLRLRSDSTLAMDTLAVRLTVPPVGSVGDFHSLVSAPCRVHQIKRGVNNIDTVYHLLSIAGGVGVHTGVAFTLLLRVEFCSYWNLGCDKPNVARTIR